MTLFQEVIIRAKGVNRKILYLDFMMYFLKM